MGDGMSDTDRQLGRAEQELAQAIEALRECKDVLQRIWDSASQGVLFPNDAHEACRLIEAQAPQPMRMADHVLALYAKRSIGTECAAVAKDVLLAGLGKI
jgi:hypothetical protein